MAKKIKDEQLCEVKEKILHGNSFLEKEAFELGISKEQLVMQLQGFYSESGGKKNSQYKAIIKNSEMRASRATPEELEKYRILPKPTNPKTVDTVAIVSEPVEAYEYMSESEIKNETGVEACENNVKIQVEKLLAEKDTIIKMLQSRSVALGSAREVLNLRENSLSKAKIKLEKAQMAVAQAEASKAEAQAAVAQAEMEHVDAKLALQCTEQKIEELKAKTIYLVDPLFTGEYPEFGTFISTVEMDGVITEEVPADCLPDESLDGVFLFDYVPDYKKARVFCGLVWKYELEEKAYRLLVSDERVKELLEMYIGK